MKGNQEGGAEEVRLKSGLEEENLPERSIEGHSGEGSTRDC